MRKISVVAAAGLALALVGCENFESDYDHLKAQLTAAIVKTCQFVPTANTVADLLDAWDVKGSEAVTAIGVIAQKVCASVTAKAAGPEGWEVTGPDGEEVEINGVWAR